MRRKNVFWEFKIIKSHQGPFNSNHMDYKESSYNVTIGWKNGEITDDFPSIITVDVSFVCVMHGLKNELLDKEEWKRLDIVAKKSVIADPRMWISSLPKKLPDTTQIYKVNLFNDNKVNQLPSKNTYNVQNTN